MSLMRLSPWFAQFPFEEFSLSEESLTPPVNISDTKEGIVVETSLPGVDPQEIELSCENGMLTIKGSSKSKTEVDEKNYYRKEIRSGSFLRQLSLPTGIQEDAATALVENGILTVTFPKAKLPAPKKISITSSHT